MMDRNSSEVLLQQIRSCTILIHRLIHSEHSSVKRGPMEGGIGRGQGLVLRVLAENDGLAQSELAEELDIRPSSLGELVMKLEEAGLVERRRNEDNKRVVNVFLTEKGRAAEKECVNPRRQAAEAWCVGLTEEEKEQFSGLLSKLNASMEELLAKNESEWANGEIPFERGCPGRGRGGGGPRGAHGPDGNHGPRGPRPGNGRFREHRREDWQGDWQF